MGKVTKKMLREHLVRNPVEAENNQDILNQLLIKEIEDIEERLIELEK